MDTRPDTSEGDALDAAGNSMKVQFVVGFLSRRLGLDLFVSAPRD